MLSRLHEATYRILAVVLVLAALAVLYGRPVVKEIVISKSARTLTAFAADGGVIASVPIGLGRSPEGHKYREGDERTPEGEYYVCFKNTRSKFHLSFGLSYPNLADAERGRAEGVIDEAEFQAIEEAHRRVAVPPWKTALGGEIFIHGGLDRHPATAGCVAIRDADVETLFPLVDLGTRVVIEP